jgi:hypothetical protein
MLKFRPFGSGVVVKPEPLRGKLAGLHYAPPKIDQRGQLIVERGDMLVVRTGHVERLGPDVLARRPDLRLGDRVVYCERWAIHEAVAGRHLILADNILLCVEDGVDVAELSPVLGAGVERGAVSFLGLGVERGAE